MLRFFSKIRYQLAAQNRVAKYLRYAIGEILLVVIGILIAIQVNNWNEYQKQLKVEKEILKELIVDLESDYDNITKSINNHREYIESQDIIINWIDRNYEYNDSLIPHFRHLSWTSLFFPKDAQFESLNQFGIGNISNKALSDQIKDLYDNIYKDLLYWQDEQKNTSIYFKRTWDELGFEFVSDTDTKKIIGLKPINPKALQSNKAFLFNLNLTRATLKNYTGVQEKARNEILKTIKMLESDIENDTPNINNDS